MSKELIIFSIISMIAMLNAMMDTIKDHWDRSIFKDIKWKWLRDWLKSDWRERDKYFLGLNAWHTFKALILLYMLSLIWWLSDSLSAISAGLGWIIFFNIFYDHILIRKKED